MDTDLILFAQSLRGNPQTVQATLMLTLGVVGAGMIIVSVWLIRTTLRRAAERDGFLGLQLGSNFEPVDDRGVLSDIAQDISTLFGEQAMYARQLRIAGALRRVEDDGLILDATQVRLGMEESNANINTLAKLVLLIHHDHPDLPDFSLLPNHFLFSTVQQDPVFHHSGSFGKRNLVLGEDKWFIAQVLSGETRNMLADNRDLVIESRRGLLAFYLHDERVQPKDLPGFIDHCRTLARHMIDNAQDGSPAQPPDRPTHHPLLPA